ncbi:hypothetical protein FLAG1_05214 [Fusarium langsethiae]|uniref:Uncharacterized protein n=1 Tax=Fusarium langsethiae TaxID=179993 RepID=A0A0M9EXX0_FUSLA|nr:hypothetical protein FLAG1_05214 [Fusarium langsethiae]GKU02818.1 unnamed protein product [Fusarium langsethiae]GKU16354.1 unnamed protein product [Fusarium langsethiae]
MPRRRSSRRHSVNFLEALGQWTMSPESSHRSSRHSGRPSHRDTETYRQARLSNVPPALDLTARQWREYADHAPAGYCTDGEDGDDGREDVRQSLPPVTRPEPDPIRSVWSHSSGSVVTRAHGAVRRRDSPLDRIVGRTSFQEPSSPLLRDEVSFDANNDQLLANVPHFKARRDADDVVVHQERASDHGFVSETFGQRKGEAGSQEDDQREREVSAQPLRESGFFSDPRLAPWIQQADSDVWPTVQGISRVSMEHSRSRVGSWRNTIIEVPEGRYGIDQEPSVFGGSHVTVWPGPDQGRDTANSAPYDSATQIAMYRRGQDSRGPYGSRVRDPHNGSSRPGGSRQSRGRH